MTHSDEVSELLPCPFCGEPAEVDMSRGFRALRGGNLCSGVAIYCSAQCNVELMLSREDLPEYDNDQLLAILAENWNRRSVSNTAGGGDDDTEATWRDLALQFDGHRIDALSNLRYAVRCIEEYATVRDILREPLQTLKAFLAAPPLSGEKVLAARLSALEPIQAGGEPVAYMLPVTHEVLGRTGWAFYSKAGERKDYEPGEYEAHVRSITGAVPLFTRPATPVSAEVTELVAAAQAVYDKLAGETTTVNIFDQERLGDALATLDRGRG